MAATWDAIVIGGGHNGLVAGRGRRRRRVGWPVALKTAAAGGRHKSGVGGVHLGLAGPRLLAAAYADLSARSGRGWWSPAWPPAAWSWPSGWSATRSSGRW
jgi:hypothetical protein